MNRTAVALAVFGLLGLGRGSDARAIAPPSTAPTRSPLTFAYLPRGLTADPPPPALTWDDFEESYLYESPRHDRWTVTTTGIGFENNGFDFCQKIPRDLKPKFQQLTLDSAKAATRVATLRGGPKLFAWLFSNEGVAAVVMSARTKRANVSALVECSTGRAVVASGTMNARSLATMYTDPTIGGSLFMTNWAAASKPDFFTQSFSAADGALKVSLLNDPRSSRGIEVAGTEHVVVRQRKALLERSGSSLTLTWLEREGVSVVMQSRYPLPELLKIANGLTVSAQ
jgi:hypothetical protein